jgi:hypothetical protein
MAEEEGIPYRFFENDNELEKDEMDDATFFRMMKQNNPAMFSVINEKIEEPQEENFMNMKPTMEEAE